MYFVLNKAVTFYPDTNELSLIHEHHNSIMLSKAACRLLLTLIQNVNDIASRDFLLKKVWEDYGYTPSNNNLYMAISELRKALSSLGEEREILVTIPKIGLKFAAEVDVLERNEKNLKITPDNKTTTEMETLSGIDVDIHFIDKQGNKPGKNKVAIPLVYFILIILSSTVLLLIYKKNPPMNDSNDNFAFKHGTCNIFSHDISLGAVSNHDEFEKIVMNKLQENNISCNSAMKTIYFQSHIKIPMKNRDYFIGICTNIKKSSQRKCQTIYISYDFER